MPRWSMLVLTTAFATTGCAVAPETILDASALADADVPHDGSGTSDAGVVIDAAVRRLPATTILLQLDAGAFPPTPAHPSALVYIPAGFDPSPPLSVVVYLHGWNNCVENVVRDAGASCNPDGGTPARAAYALVAQLEASGRNALLLCPEVVFDAPTGNPGNLGLAGGFRALLAETLRYLAPVLGPRSIADVGQVVIMSHSGGYVAAAGIATRGGIEVHEIDLLDSLYGSTADFDAWVMKNRAALGGTTPARRFADVYTAGGGTLAESQAMATRARSWVDTDAGILIDDRTTSTWPDATYHHGLLFKLSGLSHDGVPRYYVGHLLSTGALPAKSSP